MAVARPLGAVPISVGTCPADARVGDVVRVAGPGRQFALVDITDADKIRVAGIIVRKAGTTCEVQTTGQTLQGTFPGGIEPGATYYVGLDGRPTTSRPHGSEEAVRWVVFVGVGLDEQTLLIRPGSVIGVRT